MHEALLEITGIEIANCSTCVFLGSDDDGNYPELAKSWPVCHKTERFQYLKSFPFKKEMKCWEPSFWYSTFTDLIKKVNMKRLWLQLINSWKLLIL